ncbi:hypothetical protein BS50DRAFT_486813 [Corynespora cassiicola Philippines]|uniref:Zn(2)-C6 fungal-type domain-containing protein n=1 Tax=Corynespora cassiicola Philippines TaxID=1448308 RepID=A0A2T2P1J8_CORCC|nr:hypothetical protein BS50DRAFT_486813 [Corynespora cassiicola Philippines]
MSALVQKRENTTKSQRVLACILCSQRKVKCDRKFPCANCIRAGAQCVPANTLAPRQRRRRFPERELLDRIRNYEALLRKNNISFNSLHPTSTEQVTIADEEPHEKESQRSSETPKRESRAGSETVDIWHAMNQRDTPGDGDDASSGDESEGGSSSTEIRHATVKKAMHHLFEKGDDLLLFGSRRPEIDISVLHPQQVHIFKLWQIYLDNINPLLKLTHTPTLQPIIINAVANMAGISPTIEALMFSIYCISIQSISEEESNVSFGMGRKELLTIYQLGCQQTLLRCDFLRNNDRHCLVAFYLYILSCKPGTDPRSLSSILGAAIRIAQNMGLHDESINSKFPILEAEMRRRLWWSLAIFDSRIAEMSVSKGSILMPTWDCETPSNVNDFDLRPELKEPPAGLATACEATFAVVRSRMARHVCHSSYYLDHTNPSLKPIAKNNKDSSTSEGSELDDLEKMIEEEYLQSCRQENPLHYMTIWMSRYYLVKQRLLEHYARSTKYSVQLNDGQRDNALSYALSMFECDTKLLTSPLTQGYRWYTTSQFPFQAYVHVVKDLARRPLSKHATKAWQVMSNNYSVRSMDITYGGNRNTLAKILGKAVFQAWEAHVAANESCMGTLEMPLIVSAMEQSTTQAEPNLQFGGFDSSQAPLTWGTVSVTTSVPMDFGDLSLSSYPGWNGSTNADFGGVSDTNGIASMGFGIDSMEWDPISGYS